jgi:hypothetical protein
MWWMATARPSSDMRVVIVFFTTQRGVAGMGRILIGSWLAMMCIVLSAPAAAGQDGSRVQTGFFLVTAEADSIAGLPAAGPGQQVVLYDYRFLREDERDQPCYLLMSKTADVPIILGSAPELKKKGANGFPELQLTLTPEAAAQFERFTREHLGGMVALVIDGVPVTKHKIKTVITGGKFQLSRCTDTACEFLYGRLVDKR